MKYSSRCLWAVLLTVPVGNALAQMSGSTSGRYATYTIAQDVEEREDGSSVVLAHYHQTTFAEDTSHPVDNTSAMCVGRFILDAEGSLTAATGSCFSTNVDGDGSTFWWRMTEGGTSDCPDACGEWGYVAGDGALAGIKGNGTWKRTTVFSDGSTGTWAGSYSIP